MHKRGNLKEFVSGFPTFHEAEYDGVGVINAYLILDKYAEYRFVPFADLGNPANRGEALLRAVNDFASKQDGFVTGFPNMFTGTENGKEGVGCILIKKGGAEQRDVRVGDLAVPK